MTAQLSHDLAHYGVRLASEKLQTDEAKALRKEMLRCFRDIHERHCMGTPAEGAEVVACRYRLIGGYRWLYTGGVLSTADGWELQRLIVHPEDRAATQEVGNVG